MWEIISFIPGPSHHPVFDCLQYAKTKGVHFYHVNDINVYCRMHFGQYQASSAVLGGTGNEDYYLIRTKCSQTLNLFMQQVEAPCICHSLSGSLLFKDLLNEAK